MVQIKLITLGDIREIHLKTYALEIQSDTTPDFYALQDEYVSKEKKGRKQLTTDGFMRYGEKLGHWRVVGITTEYYKNHEDIEVSEP